MTGVTKMAKTAGWVPFGPTTMHYYADGLALCDQRQQPPADAFRSLVHIPKGYVGRACWTCFDLRNATQTTERFARQQAEANEIATELRRMARKMDDAADRATLVARTEARQRAAAQTRMVANLVAPLVTPNVEDFPAPDPADWLSEGLNALFAWEREDMDEVHESRARRRAVLNSITHPADFPTIRIPLTTTEGN